MGIKHLSPKDVDTLGVVGAGVQGLNLAISACAVRPFCKICVFDLHKEKTDEFLRIISSKTPKARATACNSTQDLLEQSQVVITATNSNKPVLPDQKELLQGRHFIGIGSYKPNMREFPECLYALLSHVFMDTDHAKQESGDLTIPLTKGLIEANQAVTLGKLISGELDRSKPDLDTTLFKSVGMALFDVIVSRRIYEKAVERQLGVEVDI